MKEIKIQNGKNMHFIGSYQIEEFDCIDNLVKFYDRNQKKARDGVAGDSVNKDKKDSYDIAIRPVDLMNEEYNPVKDYILKLIECWNLYKEEWKESSDDWNNLSIGTFNIQKYPIGGHFSKWHTERSSLKTSHRQFAWMTYLNDQKDGGETEFLYYDIRIKPKKGLTLIWPAEWTHTHRGNEVKSEKYIATGWIDFLPTKTEYQHIAL